MFQNSMDWKSRSLLPRLLYIVQCRNRYRPQNNDIDWWRNYCAEFFAPNGVVRVSVKDMPLFNQQQGSTTQPLTCTEVPFEVLPRLFKYKYENGVMEELLFLGNVIESPLPAGGTSIICYQAAEHLVFDGYSLIQYGHLKVVFNAQLKVQLLDFSITGYDLHLDHSVVCGELRQLSSVLEGRSQQLNHQVSGSSPGSPTLMDPKALQETMRETAGWIKIVHDRLNQYLSYEWAYIQKTLHFMQIADVVGNLHELFHMCKNDRVSPIQAFQKFGKLSARVPHWPPEYNICTQDDNAANMPGQTMSGQGGANLGGGLSSLLNTGNGLNTSGSLGHLTHSSPTGPGPQGGGGGEGGGGGGAGGNGSTAMLNSLLAAKQQQQMQQQQHQAMMDSMGGCDGGPPQAGTPGGGQGGMMRNPSPSLGNGGMGMGMGMGMGQGGGQGNSLQELLAGTGPQGPLGPMGGGPGGGGPMGGLGGGMGGGGPGGMGGMGGMGGINMGGINMGLGRNGASNGRGAMGMGGPGGMGMGGGGGGPMGGLGGGMNGPGGFPGGMKQGPGGQGLPAGMGGQQMGGGGPMGMGGPPNAQRLQAQLQFMQQLQQRQQHLMQPNPPLLPNSGQDGM